MRVSARLNFFTPNFCICVDSLSCGVILHLPYPIVNWIYNLLNTWWVRFFFSLWHIENRVAHEIFLAVFFMHCRMIHWSRYKYVNHMFGLWSLWWFPYFIINVLCFMSHTRISFVSFSIDLWWSCECSVSFPLLFYEILVK